jgi:intracellular growth IglE-like protein
MTALRLFACLSLLWLVGTGCHYDTVYMTVHSPNDMNAGRPVRMLVRAVDQQEYVNETYQAVADKVVVKDESVLHSAVIYPNVPLAARVKRPTNAAKGMGVYFFFTSPGARWKTMLEVPVPHTAEIKLGSSNIDSVIQH